jgi:hypothetical protein
LPVDVGTVCVSSVRERNRICRVYSSAVYHRRERNRFGWSLLALRVGYFSFFRQPVLVCGLGVIVPPGAGPGLGAPGGLLYAYLRGDLHAMPDRA